MGRMLFAFASFSNSHTEYLSKLGTIIVSKINVRSPILLKKQKTLNCWREQKDYIFGLFGFRIPKK